MCFSACFFDAFDEKKNEKNSVLIVFSKRSENQISCPKKVRKVLPSYLEKFLHSPLVIRK